MNDKNKKFKCLKKLFITKIFHDEKKEKNLSFFNILMRKDLPSLPQYFIS